MKNRPTGASVRRGFTLVEMLVSVALVVMMMSMFATIFQLATGSMTKQKGIAENDQRARTAVTVIRGDLDKRSYRWIVPLIPNGRVDDPSNQRGYFYYSENDPDDDTDDVLQFTIDVTRTQTNSDETRLYGRAAQLRLLTDANPALTSLFLNQNQPEFDDGQLALDNTGSSTMGEVSYFLRGGVLYRRVMLIRVPFFGNEPQPQNATAAPYMPQTPSVYPTGLNTTGGLTAAFWKDFDYSAFNNAFVVTPSNIVFLGTEAMVNAGSDSSFSPRLGIPKNRFGHDVATGRAREYVNGGADFIGRFTHEETSHASFTYPGTTVGNPLSSATPLSLTPGAYSVAAFAGGPRRGEDILLTNVHSFDVKIFDDAPGVMRFLDLGHAVAGGYYNQANNQNMNYGPRIPPFATVAQQNRVFDTWHPAFDWDLSGSVDPAEFTKNSGDDPPFRPFDLGADGQPGVAGVDDDGNGFTDFHGPTYPTPFKPNPALSGKPDPLAGQLDAYEIGYPGSDDNLHPVRAIQIKIRYLDTTSNQMREVTIVHSFSE